MKTRKLLPYSADWSFELIDTYATEIARVAKDYKLDTYPIQIELISSEQMMDTNSTVGMPLGYYHWSYGKQFVNIEKQYRHGIRGLAYEIVINSNPCIAYLLEENDLVMQATVIAHACYGHNSFFKSNYLFKTWSQADAIIDYLLFARNFISECEEKYGIDEVEKLLDACHALSSHGVDRYQRPHPLSLAEEKAKQKAREVYLQAEVNELWRTIPVTKPQPDLSQTIKRFPSEPEENLLYFVEKNAPLLEPWQREIIRIVRKIARYFYPQKQTKVMNEGWATFWHYTIIQHMYDEGLLPDAFMLQFLQNHTNLIQQMSYDSPYFNGINPYSLGFALFSDLRRICEAPTDEDKHWFPDLVGKPWLEVLHHAMQNYKDESFIAQFLSPKVIRDLRLFSLVDDDNQSELFVDAIHDEPGYQKIRTLLSTMYNLAEQEPNLQIVNVDLRGDRTLTLHHQQHLRRPLNEDTGEVLKHLYTLWGFPVVLLSLDDEGNTVKRYQCPAEIERTA